MYPVGAETACHHDDAADAEQDDETNALVPRKREFEQSRDRERVDHEVGYHVQGALD